MMDDNTKGLVVPVAEAWRNHVAPISGGSNLREVQHFAGVRVTVLDGMGVDGNPFRNVTHYFDEKGRLVGVYDPSAEEVGNA